MDDEAVTIGGTAYPYAEGMQIQVGESVTAYLNFRGTVVYYKVSAGDANYAYIYAASPKSGLSSGYDVKILFAGPVSPKSYVETDTESGYTYSTGALFCKNSGVGVLSTDSTIRYNGKSMKAEEAIAAALSQPVRYALNKDGLLAELDTLTPASTGTKKTYNSAEQTFGKGNGSSDGAVGYGIEQGTTYAVCLPTNTDASDDDLQVFVELKDGTSYDMQGYELDEDTQMVDLIVLQSAMHASMAGVVTDGSDVAMVKKQSQVLDEDGVETIQLTLLTAEGEKDFLVSNLITDRDQFLTLSTGDLIGYSIDGFDELNGFELIQEKDRYVDYMMNQQMNGERCCGIVQSIRRNYVSDGRNRWVHGIEVVYSSAGGVRSYELYVRDMVPIFIIEDDEVSIGTFDDLLVEDRVFVTANLNVARALVIKR